jgi:hypothetical protein
VVQLSDAFSCGTVNNWETLCHVFLTPKGEEIYFSEIFVSTNPEMPRPFSFRTVKGNEVGINGVTDIYEKKGVSIISIYDWNTGIKREYELYALLNEQKLEPYRALHEEVTIH